MRTPRRLHLALPLLVLGLSAARAEWRPVTFTDEARRARGVETGDGAQWFRALAIDRADGRFMLWCTDVGGLFRSLDGGRNWEPANVGFDSRGSAAVAIDPHNPRRVLVVAANSVAHRFNGIYLSTDQAASWRLVLPVTQAGAKDRGRRSVVFDPSTYDSAAGFTRVAYWSRLAEDRVMFGPKAENKPAFLRTGDGGETWTELPGGEIAAGAHLAIHPSDGTLLAANTRGVLRSTDGGRSWTTTLEGPATGIDLSPAAPDQVWATKADSVWFSADAGRTWRRVESADALGGGEARLENITVAPSDPRRILLHSWNPGYRFIRHYSHDGGLTWGQSERVLGFNLIPSNDREGHFAFHPTDADIVLAPGGDYPALSRDGGKTFAWAGNGVNNLFVGGGFNFSAIDPDVLFLGSQDYGTLLTTDGGRHWRYFAPGGKGWGGFNYGAYASTPESLVVGESESWGGPKNVAISTNGGRSWTITDKAMAPSPFISNGDPQNPSTLFASQFRSTDGGRTWSEMNGATHVLTHDTATRHLIGIRRAPAVSGGATAGDAVVRSSDGGATWTEVFTAAGRLSDLAFDPGRERYYLVENNRLRVWSRGAYLPNPELPHDQQGAVRVRSVALDPKDPAIVYVATNRDAFATSAGALRSTDGGRTWQNLNRTEALGATPGLDGGREPIWVRVHPRTREAWFATGCYGVWRHTAPEGAR
jgi:photosystem II stability/assembly factor-like uncharacterized protein